MNILVHEGRELRNEIKRCSENLELERKIGTRERVCDKERERERVMKWKVWKRAPNGGGEEGRLKYSKGFFLKSNVRGASDLYARG